MGAEAIPEHPCATSSTLGTAPMKALEAFSIIMFEG